MRSTGIFAAFAVLAMVFLLCSCGPDRSNKIVMVTEATFPPYEFREGGRIVGIDVDLMQAVAQEIGKELVVEDMSFDSVISAVVTGKADVAASGITVTEDRKRQGLHLMLSIQHNLTLAKRQGNFSLPYVEAKQVIIVPENSAVKEAKDLKGKRIGVQHGTTGDTYVTKHIQEPERFPNGALAVAALEAGKLDAVVLDGEPSKVHVSMRRNLKILDMPLTTEEYAVAISKKNTKLLEQVNAAIKKMKENGKLAEIKAKYIK